jgi:hypothetical protein
MKTELFVHDVVLAMVFRATLGITSKLCGSINNEYNVCFILSCEMWLFALLHQRKLCNEGISYWNIKTNMPRGRMVVRFTITLSTSAYYN